MLAGLHSKMWIAIKRSNVWNIVFLCVWFQNRTENVPRLVNDPQKFQNWKSCLTAASDILTPQKHLIWNKELEKEVLPIRCGLIVSVFPAWIKSLHLEKTLAFKGVVGDVGKSRNHTTAYCTAVNVHVLDIKPAGNEDFVMFVMFLFLIIVITSD